MTCYEVIGDDNLYLVENFDPEEKVGHGVKIEKG